MRYEITNYEKFNTYFTQIKKRVEQNSVCCIKYVDLGTTIIRVVCYTPFILASIQNQLTYTLLDKSDHFDSTIVVYQEKDLRAWLENLGDDFDVQKNMRLRVEMIYMRLKSPCVQIFNPDVSHSIPVICSDPIQNISEAFDWKNKTYYYGVNNFSPEEFIKLGHIFVQLFYILTKNDTTSLVHGAVFGYDKKGALLCARGQRGKSTLTVHSLTNGCEYVSDDYQLLSLKNSRIYANPIYSIITLAPEMFRWIQGNFKGIFVSQNGRKDKDVFNIAPYHNQFQKNYPIEICLFPEIVSDFEPSLTLCSATEKGRAIVQLIHSTVMQLREINNPQVIQKLYQMIEPFPFYKLNLSPDISKNTNFVRQFLEHYTFSPKDYLKTDNILLDITFDTATILDTKSFTFYSMNKFSTAIFSELIKGLTPEDILFSLQKVYEINPIFLRHFKLFCDTIIQKGFIVNNYAVSISQDKLNQFGVEDRYKLSLVEYDFNQTKELIMDK